MIERDEKNFEEIFKQNKKLEEKLKILENEQNVKMNEIEHQEQTISKIHTQI